MSTCIDIAPFSSGCLPQSRPGDLAEVTFLGSLPPTCTNDAAWSPDGSCLAYMARFSTSSRIEIRCQPDFQLAGRWNVPSQVAFDLLWTRDSQVYSRGLALMDRNGNVQLALSERNAQWVGWGSNGYLAMLVDGSIWLVQVPAPGE